MSDASISWEEQLAILGLPVLEYIALDICRNLSLIAGFNVQRPLRGKNDWSDGSVIVCLSDTTRAEEQDQQQTTWTQVFDIMCVIVEADASTVSTDTRIIETIASVAAAVTPPDDPDEPDVALMIRRRGGYAANTTFLYPEQFTTEDGFYGVMIHVSVDYSTAWNDPYTSTTKPLS